MNVNGLATAQELKPLAGVDTEKTVTGCHIGDLLSHVMVHAKKGDAWITVMGNVNAIAVAARTGISCVILCENSPLDSDAKARAEEHGVAVYSSGKTAYELAAGIAGLLLP